MKNAKKDCAGRQVGVDCVSNSHRHSHRRSGYQPGNGLVLRIDDFGGAHQELAKMIFANEPLQAFLNAPAKGLRIEEVNAAVHESETIGGADDSIAREV